MTGASGPQRIPNNLLYLPEQTWDVLLLVRVGESDSGLPISEAAREGRMDWVELVTENRIFDGDPLAIIIGDGDRFVREYL